MKKWIFGFMLLCTSFVRSEEFALSLNSDEQYAISEIITAMGEKNIVKLFFDSYRLTRLGDSIQQVPPLQLLGFILLDPYLKECLGKISNSSFKWSSFMDGFGTNMEKEFLEERLFQDLPGFAELVGGSLEQLEEYVNQHDWDEFVKSLL